jgi:hypothetical protein
MCRRSRPQAYLLGLSRVLLGRAAPRPHAGHPVSLLLPDQGVEGRAPARLRLCPAAGTRTAAKPTADQMRVLEILKQLAVAADFRGVAAQERAARAVSSRRGEFDAVHCFVCLLHPRQRVLFAGELFQGHRVPQGAPDNGKGGGRPGGGEQGVWELRQRVSVAGGL